MGVEVENWGYEVKNGRLCGETWVKGQKGQKEGVEQK